MRPHVTAYRPFAFPISFSTGSYGLVLSIEVCWGFFVWVVLTSESRLAISIASSGGKDSSAVVLLRSAVKLFRKSSWMRVWGSKCPACSAPAGSGIAGWKPTE